MPVSGAGVAMTQKMQMQRMLLSIAAVAETLAGLALVLMPDVTIRLLLGGQTDGVGLMIGRVTGVLMLALGVACWGARADLGGAARAGTIRAITLYNAGAGILLVLFAVTGEASGLVVWCVGLLHLALAVGFLVAQRQPGASSVTDSGT
jgi:hypothetical protein